MNYEIRYTIDAEFRDSEHEFSGYVGRFYDKADEQGTTYRLNTDVLERVAPSAFTRTIADGHAIRALAYHDRTKPMGRTNTDKLAKLRLWTDERGLRFSLPYDGDHPLHREIKAGIRNGAIGGMSFAFRPAGKKGERFVKERGQNYRELLDIDISEISFVDMAAYAGAETAFRAAGEIDPEFEARYADWLDTEARLAAQDLLLKDYIPRGS